MSTRRTSNRQLLKQLIHLIHTEMRDGHVTVSHLASTLNISTSQLNRRVNQAIGISASSFIMKVRLEAAKRLLLGDGRYDNRVSDVASRCGFADVSHFCHVFKRIYGITPLQFVRFNTKLVNFDELITSAVKDD